MLKKWLPLTMFVLFIALALTACGGPAATDAPAVAATTDGAAEPAAVEASDDQVTLSAWGFEGESEFFDALIEGFEAKYPNVDVVVTDIPEDEYTTKIETALLAGDPPDLGFIYEPKWIAAGHFLPLSEQMEASGINVDDYNPGAMENCIFDDEVYCLGTYTGAIMMFYNKDIFDAAGVEYPSSTEPMTMEEYVAMAQQVTKKGDSLEDSVWGADADIGIWWQDWRNFIGEDGRKIEGYVNDDATVRAFDLLAQLRADGSALSGADQATLEGVDLLATGQLATSIVDNVIAIPLLENSGARWGAALVPVEQQGDEPWTTTWTDGYGVFSQSEHKEEAANFVAFMGQEANQMRLENGDTPLNMTMLDEWAGTNEGRQEAVEVFAAAAPGVFVPGYWDVVGPLWDAFYGDMLEDGRPAQEVLDEYAPVMQDTLDQAWATWESFASTD